MPRKSRKSKIRQKGENERLQKTILEKERNYQQILEKVNQIEEKTKSLSKEMFLQRCRQDELRKTSDETIANQRIVQDQISQSRHQKTVMLEENRKVSNELSSLRNTNYELEMKRKNLKSSVSRAQTLHEKNQKNFVESKTEWMREIEEKKKVHDEEQLKLKKINEQHAREKDEIKQNLKIFRENYSYELEFPMSSTLTGHLEIHPDSFNIQFIGSRGVGKSSLINYLRKKLNVEILKKASTGCIETTTETEFYDVSAGFAKELNSSNIRSVFFCDQPGIGGNTITRSGYLKRFSPGHFDLTFVLGQNGLNEDEIFLLKHLKMYGRPLMFIRNKIDADLYKGSSYDKPVTFDTLKSQTENFVEKHFGGLVCLYLGREPRRTYYRDFDRLIGLIKIALEHFDTLKSADPNTDLTSLLVKIYEKKIENLPVKKSFWKDDYWQEDFLRQ